MLETAIQELTQVLDRALVALTKALSANQTTEESQTQIVQPQGTATMVPISGSNAPMNPEPAPGMVPLQQAQYQQQYQSLPQQPQQNQPQQQQIPTTATTQSYTLDALSIASAGLVDMGKQQQLMAILQNFGVHSLVELTPDKYSAFAGAIKAEGAKI